MNIVSKIKNTHSKIVLGIHTHNNLGLALSNTVTAIKRGVKGVDSTVMGMGRGAGNAQTEYLIIEIQSLLKKKINVMPLLKLKCLTVFFLIWILKDLK